MGLAFDDPDSRAALARMLERWAERREAAVRCERDLTSARAGTPRRARRASDRPRVGVREDRRRRAAGAARGRRARRGRDRTAACRAAPDRRTGRAPCGARTRRASAAPPDSPPASSSSTTVLSSEPPRARPASQSACTSRRKPNVRARRDLALEALGVERAEVELLAADRGMVEVDRVADAELARGLDADRAIAVAHLDRRRTRSTRRASRCWKMPAERIRYTNGAELPSMTGSSGPSTSIRTLSMPRPKQRGEQVLDRAHRGVAAAERGRELGRRRPRSSAPESRPARRSRYARTRCRCPRAPDAASAGRALRCGDPTPVHETFSAIVR